MDPKSLSDSFVSFLGDVASFSDRDDIAIWYRGHARGGYRLVPALYRDITLEASLKVIGELERSLYLLFRSDGSPQVTRLSGFDLVCLMQHYGVPTRLLDWTQSLATALFFAKGSRLEGGAHIWALAASKLNLVSAGTNQIVVPDPSEWRSITEGPDVFIPSRSTIAVWPATVTERLRAQQGTFTLHGKYTGALDNEPFGKPRRPLPNTVLRRFDVPYLPHDVDLFLQMMGISGAYSLFPDLSALGTDLANHKRRFLKVRGLVASSE